MKKLLSILVLAILAGCYYDTEEELYPDQNSSCDTTNVTYALTIYPLINSNCTSCHNGQVPETNILLTDYATISAQAAISAGQFGSLYGAISHDPGNSPMPKNAAQLTDCEIKQVKIWIDAGSPNN
jgi:hypothetical protein